MINKVKHMDVKSVWEEDKLDECMDVKAALQRENSKIKEDLRNCQEAKEELANSIKNKHEK